MKKFLAILLSATMLLGSIGLSSAEAFYVKNYYQREVKNFGAYIYGSINDYNLNKLDKNEEYGSLIIVNKNSLTSDGLSASGLVGATNGLLLPTSSNIDLPGIEFELIDYIGMPIDRIRDLPDTVYIIGGPKAINPLLDGQLRNEGINVKRIQGKNRIETSYNVAKEIKALKNGKVTEMAVTRAYKGDADAVCISSEANRRKMPIILTNGSNLPKESPLGAEVKKIYAIGGPAVIKDSLIKQLKAERIAGKNRYETSAKILNKFGRHDGITVVSGRNESLGDTLLASTIDTSKPILMTKEKPDNYLNLLSGSKALYIANEEIDRVHKGDEFVMATYGKEVFNKYRKLLKLNLSEAGFSGYFRDEFTYQPEDNYFKGTSITSKDYIIFSTDYLSIAASKKSNKIYAMPKEYEAPIDLTNSLEK